MATHPGIPVHATRPVTSNPSREVRARAMVTSRVVTMLTVLTALLAGAAALVGVFSEGGSAPATMTSVRGEVVELYAEGIYRYDSIFKGAANRGSDVVTLAIAIPLLAITLARYRRRSIRAGLLLLGTLVWFLYVGVSLALGTAYNSLFLVYVALFSASLFAVVSVFRSIDPEGLAARCSPTMPRRVPGVFMLVSGMVTFVIWTQPLVTALIAGEPPEMLDNSMTMVTETLDLGVIVPIATLSGVLILRRWALGYIMAFTLLVLEALLAPMMVMQAVYQLDAGVDLSSGQAIGTIGGFAAIALTAVWVIALLLRHISEIPVETGGLR